MASLLTGAGPLEAVALRRAVAWDPTTMTLGLRGLDFDSPSDMELFALVRSEFDGKPTLLQRLEIEAAVFEVQGDGAAGQRALEPLTDLARAVEADGATMTRMRSLLSSIDDLGPPHDLRRIGFAATDHASAALGLLGDLRPVARPPGFDDDVIDALIDIAAADSAPYATYTGYYQHGRGELVISPRVARHVLHESFEDVASPLPQLLPSTAARIVPHELFHARQPTRGSSTGMPAAWTGVNEGTASIVGNLRAGTVLRGMGHRAVGLDAVTMYSNYNEYSRIISGLARLGNARLDDATQVARFEQRMAAQAPLDVLEGLAGDAARWQAASATDIGRAAEAGLEATSSAVFEARLAAAGVQPPDTSLDWVYAESRRRAAAMG